MSKLKTVFEFKSVCYNRHTSGIKEENKHAEYKTISQYNIKIKEH